ncbi:MAG TPA: N-acetylmuramoyl-L-alanine amidase [Thermoanaerobaculia bacterium]|nr:N-acetylmuramoyl-L-alanine amidase [Thermoanaerobaculia bacterium]
MGKIHRIKSRVLREAVAENVDTIRGLPPRAARRLNRAARVWLHRAPLLIVPLALIGATYLTRGSAPAPPPPVIPSAVRNPVPVAAADVASTRLDMTPISASVFPLSVHRVVIDAGHGGTDPGASSTANLTEKAVTLDIATRLRDILRRNGFDVVVTRAGDRLIALRDRAAIANSSNGDIFVSIHVNSLLTGRESHGIETYYLGATNDPTLTRLAADENRGSGYSVADLRKLLDGIYADVRRDESHRLAAAVQQQLFNGLRSADPGVKDWGVKRAPFVVLVATGMPAVLAEVGCLSNDKEAAMLGRPEYRQQIAQALFHGIHAYASAGDAPKKGNGNG